MKKILISMMAIAFCFNVSAQDTVYFAKKKTTSYGKDMKRSSEANIIKFAPLSFISGYIPLYYEREITPFFSVQAGAGITTRNYLKEWANNFDFSDNQNEKNTWNAPGNEGNGNAYSMNDYTNRQSSLGYYFSVQPRIYFENEGMEGSFIGISYDHFRYNMTSDKIKNGTSSSTGYPIFTNDSYKEFDNITDISANFGSQALYDHISLEYTVGIALRNVTGTRYAYTNDYNTGQYIDGFSTIKKTTPAFTFSIKVGYHY